MIGSNDTKHAHTHHSLPLDDLRATLKPVNYLAGAFDVIQANKF
jgi:hypothetical protein